MTEDEKYISALIERWAKTVHAGDLDGVLADHSSDIVMFDVPPPNEGVRGIDAYRATWPPFFEWQRKGASFEIVSLDVTAGDDVAFAHALLRCGTDETAREGSGQPPSTLHRVSQAERPVGRLSRASFLSIAVSSWPAD